ncbi:MAG: O-antigen ligase family protein [Candidatus Wallbacteria bacterium]|nr:O-antigen ligase family protein [Candidatus Wallbacteria bacterium]
MLNKKKVEFFTTNFTLTMFTLILWSLILKICHFEILMVNFSLLINLSLLWLFFSLFQDETVKLENQIFIFRLVEICGIAIGLIALAQLFDLFHNLQPGREKLLTTLGNVDFTAAYLGFSVICSLILVLKKTNPLSILNLLNIPLIFYCRSRIVFFALIPALLIPLFYSRKYLKIGLVFLAVCFFMICCNQNFRSRYYQDVKKVFTGDEERFFIWKVSLEMLKANPMGVGTGNYAYYFPYFQKVYFQKTAEKDWPQYRLNFFAEEAHNEYLQFICETGIPGFFLLIIFFISVIKHWIESDLSKLGNQLVVCWSAFGIMLCFFDLTIHVVPLGIIVLLTFIMMDTCYRKTIVDVKPMSAVILVVLAIIFYYNSFSEIFSEFYLYKGVSSSNPVLKVFFLEKAVSLAPRNPRALFEMGNCCMEQGEYQKSADWLLKTAAISNMPAVFSNLGGALTMMGMLEEGEKQIRLALEMDPHNFAYQYKLAYNYFVQKKMSEAQTLLNRIVGEETEPQLKMRAVRLLNSINSSIIGK